LGGFGYLGVDAVGEGSGAAVCARGVDDDAGGVDEYGEMAVLESWPGPEAVPEGLTAVERELYGYLRGLGRGRLEQEFIPRARVEAVVRGWRDG
jgi:hypothetical protein